MKKYFPILLSKKGELVALQHLSQPVKEKISPIIQVIRESLIKEIKDKETDKVVSYEYPDTLEKYFRTHWNFFGNQVMFDFSLFKNIESCIPIIDRFILSLITGGVNVILTVQTNSPNSYLDLVTKYVEKFGCEICYRASNDSGGFLELDSSITNLIEKIKVEKLNTWLLIDIGQVNSGNYNLLASVAGFSIQSLSASVEAWGGVIVAASSFPENLTAISISKPEPTRLTRYEWLVWKTINKVQSLKNVQYGDFGSRSATFSDVGFRGTVSLKYSLSEEYLIYRGELTDIHSDGHGQYITHTKHLVSTKDYSGKNFSWGDLKIFEISQQEVDDDKRKTGNSTNWVQFSQNHHITLLTELL